MKKLNESEIDEVINIAYDVSEKTILNEYNKKDFEDINIDIKLDSLENGFDIDISILLDSDIQLPDNLSQKAIENSLKAIDEYIEERNKKLEMDE